VGASVTHLYAASQCQTRKTRAAKNRLEAMQGRVAFYPMAVESFGGWGSIATDVFRDIAMAATRHQAQVPGGPELDYGEALDLIYNQLSCSLQTTIGRSILDRSPPQYYP